MKAAKAASIVNKSKNAQEGKYAFTYQIEKNCRPDP